MLARQWDQVLVGMAVLTELPYTVLHVVGTYHLAHSHAWHSLELWKSAGGTVQEQGKAVPGPCSLGALHLLLIFVSVLWYE